MDPLKLLLLVMEPTAGTGAAPAEVDRHSDRSGRSLAHAYGDAVKTVDERSNRSRMRFGSSNYSNTHGDSTGESHRQRSARSGDPTIPHSRWSCTMSTLHIPQAPGIAGRGLSPAEVAGVLAAAGQVDRLARRISRDTTDGVRVLLASIAAGMATRDASAKP